MPRFGIVMKDMQPDFAVCTIAQIARRLNCIEARRIVLNAL